MKPGISYIRFSSKIQGTGTSEGRQSENFATFCQAHNLTPYHEKFFDAGKSGFKGHHRDGDFGRFLGLVETGKIPKGSVLVVEALDRFSREAPLESAATLQAICKAGIEVGIVSKNKIFTYADLKDMGSVISLMVDLCAAHDFSVKLSMRMKAARKSERDRADGMTKAGRKTKACPSWLDADGDKWVFNKKAVLLKEAVMLSIAGHGQAAIKKKLGLSGSAWGGLANILRSRTLMGEYQPHYRDDGKQKPTGDPITDFYPALLTLKEFHQLQESLDSRTIKISKRGGDPATCLFTGLIFNEYEEPMLIHRMSGNNKPILLRKGNSKYRQIDYQVVESGVVDCFLTISKDMLYPSEPVPSELDAVEGAIAEVARDMALIKQRRLTNALLDLLTAKECEQTELISRREVLRAKASVGEADCLKAGQSLIAQMQKVTGDERVDFRVRLKNVIRQIVKRIEVRVINSKKAGLTVTLKSGVTMGGSTEKKGGWVIGLRELKGGLLAS